VATYQVGLPAVVEDKDLAVLKRGHGAGVLRGEGGRERERREREKRE
jgi:hypothetical protein